MGARDDFERLRERREAKFAKGLETLPINFAEEMGRVTGTADEQKADFVKSCNGDLKRILADAEAKIVSNKRRLALANDE